MLCNPHASSKSCTQAGMQPNRTCACTTAEPTFVCLMVLWLTRICTRRARLMRRAWLSLPDARRFSVASAWLRSCFSLTVCSSAPSVFFTCLQIMQVRLQGQITPDIPTLHCERWVSWLSSKWPQDAASKNAPAPRTNGARYLFRCNLSE